MSSLPIEQPGTIYSPCGKWGCGDHGECSANNTCTCQPGWTGKHCEIAPVSPPNAQIGDFECGNWGVYGTLTLGVPGYAPSCDCSTTGMGGSRCERECETSADCGSGTCDTELIGETNPVGRCVCSEQCFIDSDCSAGTCESNVCTAGWTDVKCRRATSNECSEESGCGEGGSCINNTCVCDLGYAGLRCENKLAGTGEACTYSSDCKDAIVQDVCVNGVCPKSGTECVDNEHCRVICREGLCTYPLVPPDITDQHLDDVVTSIVEELMSKKIQNY